MFFLCLFTTFLIFVPILDAEHWLIRGQEYVKPLYFLLAVILLVINLFGEADVWNVVNFILLLASILYCLEKFVPLTILYKTQLKGVLENIPERQLKILVYNVFQENEKYEKLIHIIDELNPHLILLLETDEKWDKALTPVYKNFKYINKEIRNDTYGLIFMCQFDCIEGEIDHLVSKKIPSISFKFEFQGQKIRAFGLHPKPPIIGESLYSSKKDKEFESIAQSIYESSSKMAHIAIGDFNEVSWGRTFKRFWKKSKLLDPRRGRFFKSTFPTYLPFRVPLDHVLCSSEFELVRFDRLEHIGSDHFPLYCTLQLKQ